MKTNQFQERFYRKWSSSIKLNKINVVERESDLLVLSDFVIEKKIISKSILKYRKQIESYIKKNKNFLTSLKPIKINKISPEIIKKMANAAKISGVGPMASVAGAISEYVGKDFQRKCKDLIIENGGDIFIKTSKKRLVGIYAGNSELSGKISLEIDPEDSPLGICTSSGTVGHSLSFGSADAVIVISNSAIIADCFATAIANKIKIESDIVDALKFVKIHKEIKGIVIIFKNILSAFGKIKIVKNK